MYHMLVTMLTMMVTTEISGETTREFGGFEPFHSPPRPSVWFAQNALRTLWLFQLHALNHESAVLNSKLQKR